MFVVFLTPTTPAYVYAYSVCSLQQFNKEYINNPHVLFIRETDLQGKALKNFIQNYNKYFVSNGKLVLDMNK